MRILHIDTGREMRGGQRQILLLMRGLADAGHECTLLARERSPLWEAAKPAGFAVYTAGLSNVWCQSQQVALVHAHDARAHSLAAIASRRTFVVSRRVAFPVRRTLFSRWKYRRATRFLAVSQFVAKELEAAGIAKEKIDVVYDGIESSGSPESWSAEYPAVALASSDPQKGSDLVEQAAGLAGIRVRFSADLTGDLQRASMFVYITRSEGLGSAVLLAMSMGVPVIASCEGGVPEIIEHGVSGLLVKSDPQEIACAMRRILNERGLSAAISRRARARIVERFTKDHLVRATLNSYERALAG